MNRRTQFTAEQIRLYVAYEKVRKGGRFNMFDPRARASTGLSQTEYVFVMENFGALQHQHREAHSVMQEEP